MSTPSWLRATCVRATIASLVLAIAALILALVPGLGAAAGRPATIPDATVLFGRAVKIVRGTSRPTFARAVMLEVDGFTRGGKKVGTAAGIVKWRFVLNNQPSRSRFSTATIVYGPPPAKFGKVTGFRQPFVEDLPIPRAPKMTLAAAVARLKQAGFSNGFFNVTLRKPLAPKRLNPLYIFTIGAGRFVAVDTVTKRVRPFH